MNFWEGETCEYCSGPIVEMRVTLHRKRADGYVLIENFPDGVCQECGARYFTANVLKTIEACQLERQPVAREVLVPIYTPYPA
jgi:YgiT-type zinc finger domain-containing protein